MADLELNGFTPTEEYHPATKKYVDDNIGVNTDETTKVSANDTTSGYLNGKLVAGTNVTLSEGNNGGNETLTINASVAGGSGDMTAAVYDPTNIVGDAFLRSNHTGSQSISTVTGLQTELDEKALKTNVLERDNTDVFTPTLDYHPSTKKYVDDNAVGGGTDENVKVSANDTTAGFLNGKLVAGANITLTEGNDGANETLTIAGGAGGSGAFTTTANVTSNSTGDYATDDFVFGSPQLGDDGDSTHDSRMFFDKSKGAFRAGIANSTHWNDSNVGSSSVAIGTNAIASGQYASAIGYGTNASANYSIAMGGGTTASANYSIAMGVNTTASADSSTAIGYVTTASANYSTVMGKNYKNNKSYSLSLGYGTGNTDTAPTGLVRLHADVDQDDSKKSAIELAPCTVAPTDTTNLLYNLNGNLMWNGTQLN